jgi:hypothetical protein
MPTRLLIFVNYITLSFFLIVLVDVIFLHGYLKNILPTKITDLAWYYLFFGLPHIIASFVSYCNKEYVSHYKKLITRGLIINVLIYMFFIITWPALFVYFFIAYTLYHFSKQQLGLCRGKFENKYTYMLWSTTGLLTAVSLALSIGGESFVYVPYTMHLYLEYFGIMALSLFTLISIFFCKKDTQLLTTCGIIICSAIAILLGYYIVGIFMVIFSHDISAFSIYIKHDKKWRDVNKKNFLYDSLRVKSEYVFVCLPLCAVGVAYILREYTNIVFSLLVLLLSLMHYYLEGHVWKRGTLHRMTLGPGTI